MNQQSISILLVSDDAQNQQSRLELLEELPFSVIYRAKSAKEGLEQFYINRPDIVYIVLQESPQSGLALSSEIKKESSKTPIILILAEPKKELLESVADIGVDCALFEPVSTQRLKKLLTRHLANVAERRELLSQHRLLEEYKAAMDASASVTKTDAKGIITYVNDAFCIMTGYTREELLGEKHSIVKHPDTPKAIHADLWRTITKKRIWKGRIQNIKKDGTPYYEYAVVAPIVNERGLIVEFIAIRQDITDTYRQEKYLKKRIEEEVQKNLLETKYATIGKMAAGITHEINTPLTYIRGNLELMLQDIRDLDIPAKNKEYINEDARVISEGVDRIANIVESMREASSQSKGVPESANIYATLITALTLSYNKSKQVTQISIKDEIFTVNMNKERFVYTAMIQKQRIEQVWVIIINNAIDVLKHKDDYSKRRLEISIESEHEYVVVRFKDNGGGIDEAILPKIFDPFESTKEEGGIGIGLNVAQRIVDDHKGKIVASNYEDGALFEVYLPKA